eukprot:CAMPEP_0182494906 /NCGR_PEP_ID=MMETSP1321-20130603/3733_1 /TAXON_ID=91990 /ORGANISM="Bolidomonas sp., Strain RCC1657" /LENGTH=35 /DNA_ID= /DNA_START= /DNA_END= /DNA_ORIENTATION=
MKEVADAEHPVSYAGGVTEETSGEGGDVDRVHVTV